jgi:hypothetical protein
VVTATWPAPEYTARALVVAYGRTSIRSASRGEVAAAWSPSGNALVQARAHGFAADPRELVRRTQDLTVYSPRGEDAAWDRAAERVGLA